MSTMKYGMSAINCTRFPALETNPDISGIGVIVAFLGSAYLTAICCISKAVVDYKRVFRVGYNNSLMNRWSHALEIVIIGLSDQQIITGLSVIVGGLTQLGWGLETFHFQTIGSLAWFSAIAHLFTLTILRDELRSTKLLRYFRLSGMGLLAIMLICISVPMGYVTSPNFVASNLPAWCLYHPKFPWGYHDFDHPQDPSYLQTYKEFNWVYVTFTLGLLVYTFCTRAVILCKKNADSHAIFRLPPGQPWVWIEKIISRFHGRSTRRTVIVRIGRSACYKALRANYCLLVVAHELYRSRIWESSSNTIASAPTPPPTIVNEPTPTLVNFSQFAKRRGAGPTGSDDSEPDIYLKPWQTVLIAIVAAIVTLLIVGFAVHYGGCCWCFSGKRSST
ncbi:hypothetical protein HYALB_00000690 [Hymenoscyphus albidus]|uniref:Uncharacterized protein n=1 Tax=Hymenoscyphus albidus TaxID=595503 RepID=A0A9N9LMH5_9HELO|nr:hypothetical protein HYALB_00000690 [Hymenoscyphus albidus]